MVDQGTGRWYADWPGQQPWQDPAYVRAYGQGGFNNQPGQQANNFQNGNNHNAFQQQQQPTQAMTPPTIRAEIIQVEDEGWEDYVDRFPLGPGASQMFMTRSEKLLIIKSMGQTAPLPLVYFDKRPPAPPAPKFDPSDYMRKDDAQKMIAEQVETLLSAALTAQKAPQRKQAQEVE